MKYPALLRFVCCCCFLTLISACSGLTQNSQKTVSSGNGTSSGNKTIVADDATSGSGNARDELLKAMQALFAAPSYRNHSVISQSDGTNRTMTLDYVAPDRYQYVREGEIAGGGAKKSEGIFIGSDGWLKTGDKPWEKIRANMNMAEAMQNPEVIEELKNDKTADVKPLGTESLDGAAMKVYQFSSVRKVEGETIKSTGKFWVGTTDNLPHKMEDETEGSGDAYSVKTKLTATYDYSANVKIEPPM